MAGGNNDQVTVVLSLIVNVISSISIIFVVKYLVFGAAGFEFGSAISVIHFIATFFGTVFSMWMGWGEYKRLNVLQVFPLSCAFCGSVVFNNMSLLYNSVTVYQMSKICCTPVIAVMEKYKYKKNLPFLTKVSLVIICAGSLTSVGTDVHLSFSGLMWCVLAVISGSLYTVWGKSKQLDLACTPLQLLLFQTGISSVILLFLIPLLDDISGVVTSSILTPATFLSIALSCVCAFGLNFSFFVFVGKTSGLTTNVLGYFKTTLILFLGFLLNPSGATFWGIVGSLVSCVGLGIYSYIKIIETKNSNKSN